MLYFGPCEAEYHDASHVDVMRMFPMRSVLFVVGAFLESGNAGKSVSMKLSQADPQFSFPPQTRYHGSLLRTTVELCRPSKTICKLPGNS